MAVLFFSLEYRVRSAFIRRLWRLEYILKQMPGDLTYERNSRLTEYAQLVEGSEVFLDLFCSLCNNSYVTYVILIEKVNVYAA